MAATLLAALTLGACGAFVGVRAVATARPGATTYHEVQVDGRSRRFLLHLPPDAARRRVPLVLAFHGHGGNGATLRAVSRLDSAADALGFAVVYPDGTGTLGWMGLSWNAGTCCGQAQERGVDDLAFVDTVVATLARSAPVDTARVFAVGFSAGGMLALRLACARASTFTAVADLAGAMPDVPCMPTHPVSVLLVQGVDDDELRFDLRTLPRPHGHSFAHSLEEAQRFWAKVDGCAAGVLAGDSTTSRISAHAVGCLAGVAVELISIARHPHAWPGGLATWPLAPQPSLEVDASRLVLEFFQNAGARHRLPSEPTSPGTSPEHRRRTSSHTSRSQARLGDGRCVCVHRDRMESCAPGRQDGSNSGIRDRRRRPTAIVRDPGDVVWALSGSERVHFHFKVAPASVPRFNMREHATSLPFEPELPLPGRGIAAHRHRAA